MKKVLTEYELHAKRAATPLDRRDAERVPIRLKTSYTSEEAPHFLRGEGTVADLSKTGCMITGSSKLSKGSCVTLFLYLEDGQKPMCLTGCKISWVSGESFAAEFPALHDEERKRVQELIWKHATLTASGQQRTAFRLA